VSKKKRCSWVMLSGVTRTSMRRRPRELPVRLTTRLGSSGLNSAEPLSRLRGDHIGFVFQAFHLLPHLTVLDNVLAPALFDPAGTDRTERAPAP